MKSEPHSSYASFVSHLRVFALVCLLPLDALAAPPAWWTERQVIDPNAAKNDFGPANQGQLKNIATKGYAELQARLPASVWTTPAGEALGTLVTGWNPAQGNNLAPINQGQLKAVAQKFYDVLIQVGYSSAYPWTAATTDDASFAPANIGQVKNLFSFDLGTANDADLDGIPDWWETFYGLNPANASDAGATSAAGEMTNLAKYQYGLDPTKLDFDGDGFSDLAEITNGTGPLRPGPTIALAAPSGATLSD